MLGDGAQWGRDCAALEKYLEMVVSHPVTTSGPLSPPAAVTLPSADPRQGRAPHGLPGAGRGPRAARQAAARLAVRGAGPLGRQEHRRQGQRRVVRAGAGVGRRLQHSYQVTVRPVCGLDDRVSVQGRLGQDERRDQRAAAAGAAAGPPGRRPQHHRGRQRGGQRSADRSNNLSIFCTAG